MKPNRPRDLFRRRGHHRNPGDVGYQPEILNLLRQNPHIARPGTVSFVEIRHDPYCRRPRGEPCTCNLDVQFAGDPTAN